MSYFSDREIGPRPRTHEEILPPLWGGLVALVEARVGDGSFGSSYPEGCPDAPATVVGTDSRSFGLAVIAEIPGLAEAEPSERSAHRQSSDFTGWPLRSDAVPPTLAVLDVVEFCYRHVGEPIPGGDHSFFRHRHITGFDRLSGRRKWRDDVNRLFARNGVAYELAENGEVIRLGTTVVTDAVMRARFNTGDDELDELLDRARAKYLSADPTVRRESLEQLWDAFERAKTLRDADKRKGITQLISEVASSANMAEELDSEARQLTDLGNSFRIRHHETTMVQIADTEVDYLFHRAFALVAQLLDIHPHPEP